MKTTLLLLLTCISTVAQNINTPWIDLSGSWRYITGDDPRYAQPGFDDSAWQNIQTPLPPPRNYQEGARGLFWLRRDVQLPESELSNLPPMALTVGSVAEAYEVYVNGSLMGTTGPFQVSELQLARPRTFDLPASSIQRHLMIAIRAWHPTLYGSNGLRLTDHGPWLITGSRAAPRDAGNTAIAIRQLERVGDLAQPLILICLALVVALIWLRDRRQKELFWLGLYLLVLAAGRIGIFLQVTPDSRPFRFETLWTVAGLTVLPAALLAQLTATFLRIRWLTWPVSIAALVGGSILLREETEAAFVWSQRSIQILTLLGLAWSWFPSAKAEPRWGVAGHAFATAGILLALWGHASSFASGSLIPKLNLSLMGVLISPQLSSATVMAIGMMIAIVRRLLHDRDERQRLAGEFEAARLLQHFLLPPTDKSAAAFQVDAVYQPAQEVGGDFYQLFALSDGSQLLATGDVSGKGLKAAMVVSLLTGALRNRRSDDPGSLLSELNLALCGGLDGGFVTAALARCYPDGRVTLANAGNPAPYLAGEEVALDAGLPLGLVRETEYSARELVLAPGQQLTFVSDGVVEAANANGELFGFDRTGDISTQAAQAIAEAAQSWGQNDDITVVTVRRIA